MSEDASEIRAQAARFAIDKIMKDAMGKKTSDLYAALELRELQGIRAVLAEIYVELRRKG